MPQAETSWKQTPAPLRVVFGIVVFVFVVAVALVIWAAVTHALQFF
jgi:hypothetical protein